MNKQSNMFNPVRRNLRLLYIIQTLMMAFICKAEQTENLCLRLL